jgi:uncharacterized membrane protein
MATDSQAELLADTPRPPGRIPVRRDIPWPAVVSGCLILIVNISVLAGLSLPPFLGPALGFWFLIIQPVYLLYTTSLWGAGSAAERLGYSLTGVILTLMLGGLAADLVLPLIGISRPLDPVPVVLLADVVTAALFMLRRRYPGEMRSLPGWSALRPSLRSEETRLLIAAGVAVVLAVLGANRLNNGAGDLVSLVALLAGVVTLVSLLVWRYRVREIVIQLTLYLLSLGLLLMTSLRGWFVTGHDIQNEYQVFQLTQAHGRWEIAAFHNAYNACLSITILPTELADILRVDGPYIYKVFFQLIFAACPVLVYTIARRYLPVPVAVLAVIYFISFPTFFTDMPFINRQEIALLFVCVAVLVITNDAWSLRKRQAALVVACAGVELSHYSSMYILLGILAVAWVLQAIMRLVPGASSGQHAHAPSWRTSSAVTIAPVLAAAAVMTLSWGFLATQSPGAVVSDARASISGLLGHSAAARSDNVSYSPLFGETPSAQQVLDGYRRAMLKVRDDSLRTTSYIERKAGAQRRVTAIAQPVLPLTGVGRVLSDISVPVAGLNTFVREAAAEGEELFLAVGIIALLALRRYKRQIRWEFLCLGIGGIVMLAVVTVLPGLSVDYSVLRVYQEALILTAPLIVTGSMAIFRPLGQPWAARIASGVGVAIFASTTGLLPQLLGGAPAQLNLNNSGLYYDSYYVHPQEVAGAQWLSRQNGVLPANVEATHYSDRFLFTSSREVTGSQFIEDGFPVLLRARAWVILDYSVVHTDVATASYDGDIIPYRYPVSILRGYKNLVYDNGGIEIYR